ncbi:MAG TPA: molybdate ABC transporter substrate-binding protein [Pasteurellaceae bacterium]|nr:molybdate ABC transporter substrate-binding protein [Pasteurellaceae bacterium]
MKKLIFILSMSFVFTQAGEAKVTVFAAASMTNVLQQIAENYNQAKPNEEVIFSFASSSVLARQIMQGAPANLFVSADQRWMDFLVEKEAVLDSGSAVLAGNNLVMIAPKQSKINTVDLSNDEWLSLLTDTFLAVGDPDHVPVGIYTKTAFTHLGQWAALEKKLARTNNVRAALTLVERGESPLGVVYATDAIASNKVKVVATFPKDSHLPIEYPVAIIKGHDNSETRAFLHYLKSDDAKKIFIEHGFTEK